MNVSLDDVIGCNGKGGMFYKAGDGQEDLSTQIVVGHVDRVVVTIPVSRENSQSLVEKFEQFKKYLSMKLAGDDGPTFKETGKHKDVLQYEFNAEFTKVKFRLPKALNHFFRKNKRFPFYKELFELGYRKDWLGLVEIVDRRKWAPAYHGENVLLTIQILEHYFDIEPKTIEVALDTQSQELGILLRKCVCLKNPPGDKQLFHFSNIAEGKRAEEIPGPSVDGNNEYHGYRPKGRNDTRPNDERARGGRRQIHSYDRKVYGNKDRFYTFHRFEIRFYREYIMPYAQRKNLGVYDLVLHAEELVRGNIVFRQIDCEKLQRHRREARFCKLKGKSTKGQIYMLHKQGMANQDIKRYIKKVEWPPMRFIVDPKNDESNPHDYEFYFWSPAE